MRAIRWLQYYSCSLYGAEKLLGEKAIQMHMQGLIATNTAIVRFHNIFDPFFITKQVGQDTGMGVAIAHQTITEKHKGDLSVTSEIGKGSTFSIKLPL